MAISTIGHTDRATWAQRLGMALAVFICSALSTAAWADPPGRVGRIGETSGQVWMFSPDGGEWVSAPRNQPLTTGDRLATDSDGRAEVRIGSTTVRLDAGTELEVLRIDDDRMALQLHGGSVAVRLRNAEAAREFELQTVEGRFVANRPGRYRFDRADETSHVTVWSGEAMYEGPGSALTVTANQNAEFWIDRGAAQYAITEPVRDAFATWTSDTDRRDERSASSRYVSPEMTGAEDLDRYGRWEQAPDYGAVWIPSAVSSDWAPYQAGHWAYVSPWGWTWVDDQPWGFAPFHYGRWAMYRDRWCWVPGTYVRRPVYAPALVAWVGGPRLSVSISVGNTAPAVGWFPLAPREVYVPNYRVSPRYVQQVNITHVTNITNITTIVNNPQQAVVNVDYRNRHLPRAVTVVPQTVLVNRQPVGPVAGRFRDSDASRRTIAEATQKVGVVSAPPVPTPPVDEVRRRHGFSPDGSRPAAPAGRAPLTPQQAPGGQPGANVASTAVNIPPPPSRVAAPQIRPNNEGEARGRTPDRGRRDARDDARDARPGATPAPAATNAAPNAAPNAAANPAQPGRPNAANNPPNNTPANAPGNAGDERRGRPQAGVPPGQQQPAPGVPVNPGQRRDGGPIPAPERAAQPAAPAQPAPVAPAAAPQAPAQPPQANVRTVPPPPRSQPDANRDDVPRRGVSRQTDADRQERQDAQRQERQERQDAQRQQQEAAQQRQRDAAQQRQAEGQRQQLEAQRQQADAQRRQEAAQQRQVEAQRQMDAAQARQRGAAPTPPVQQPAPAATPPARQPEGKAAPAREKDKDKDKDKEPSPRKPEARGPAGHDQQLAREEGRQRGDDERRRHQGGDRERQAN